MQEKIQCLPREWSLFRAMRTFFRMLFMIAVSRFFVSRFSRTRPSMISSKLSGNLAPKLPYNNSWHCLRSLSG